jgi:3-oxoacyl-[acyl-carrier protein] reductase
VEQLTRQLAPEFGARQITINTLAPGPTETDMLLSGKTPEQVAAQTQFIAQMTALGRLGQPRDIADIVAFLASDDARWINGQTIYANGGFA